MTVVGTVTDGAPASISVRDLVVRYGSRSVVDGVSFEVHPGELVALLGPNGAGKTTTVEAIEGFRPASAGTVRLLGEDPRRGGPALRSRMGSMLQEGGLEPRSTPRELVRLEAGLRGRPTAAADAVLERVGLAERAGDRIRRLSGGERQRTALAIALVGEPEVLVLDEPTAGLDPAARRSVRGLITGLRDAGRAILLTTHDLGDVKALADRVLILHRGRLVAEGPPTEVGGAGGGSIQWIGFDRALADTETAALASWAAQHGLRISASRSEAADLEARYLALTDDLDVEHVE